MINKPVTCQNKLAGNGREEPQMRITRLISQCHDDYRAKQSELDRRLYDAYLAKNNSLVTTLIRDGAKVDCKYGYFIQLSKNLKERKNA